MANHARFSQSRITAASLQYPLGTIVKVVSLTTGKGILVTITDRGPWCKKFSLDLSKAAYKELGLAPAAGWGWVIVSVLPQNF